MATISTPCINVCVVEPSTGLCIGCGRTTVEIAAWVDFSEADRQTIMEKLGARLSRLTSRSPGESDIDGIPARRRRGRRES